MGFFQNYFQFLLRTKNYFKKSKYASMNQKFLEIIEHKEYKVLKI
jgi:hypothetical protein